ncbi:MAG: ribonuclease HII [Treponema sp.]|nr:ribonuclease HII [Treponema sp.]
MICGIDEAGRGPLAGPVCAAAVVLPADFPVNTLADSKKLKPKQREEACRIITEKATAWGVGWASHAEIDAINILQASLLAMQRAFDRLLASLPEPWPDSLVTEAPFGRPFVPALIPAGLSAVVDGLHTPALPISCTALVKADDTVHAVMAASILAKTARDQLMVYYGSLYPQYGYEGHKGYPTQKHRELVLQHGPSPIQRKSFSVGTGDRGLGTGESGS